MALVVAIALGYLPLVGFLRLVTTAGPAPLATVTSMGIAALAAAVVAVATLPGVGGRLTPDLLRRE